eukprot:GHVQ01016359.1.p1 GENE.GHVQ01016359.1~~GHVQ01016359.1.p1  ORF type:complete len:433 (+),score=63.23 GHVQ01016359.1:119-1417(+)
MLLTNSRRSYLSPPSAPPQSSFHNPVLNTVFCFTLVSLLYHHDTPTPHPHTHTLTQTTASSISHLPPLSFLLPGCTATPISLTCPTNAYPTPTSCLQMCGPDPLQPSRVRVVSKGGRLGVRRNGKKIVVLGDRQQEGRRHGREGVIGFVMWVGVRVGGTRKSLCGRGLEAVCGEVGRVWGCERIQRRRLFGGAGDGEENVVRVRSRMGGLGRRVGFVRRQPGVRRYVSPSGGVGFGQLDGAGIKVGIVKARWNSDITDKLVKGVREGLTKCGVSEGDQTVIQVPGAYELPMASKWLCMSGKVDVVVAVGCLVKGETFHFEYISDAVSHGLMKAQLDTSVPVVFGVLTVNELCQAQARCSGEDNHGTSWGLSAVEMALMRRCAAGEAGGGRSPVGFAGGEGSELSQSERGQGGMEGRGCREGGQVSGDQSSYP